MLTTEDKEYFKNYEAMLEQGLTVESRRYLSDRDERDLHGFKRGRARHSWWHYVYAIIDDDVYLVRWHPTASAGDLRNWTARRFALSTFLISKYRDTEYAKKKLLR